MDADRRRQNDLSRANIVRAQVLFLCSTLNEENLEDKLQELKKVKQSYPLYFPSPQYVRLDRRMLVFTLDGHGANAGVSWRKKEVTKLSFRNLDDSLKQPPLASSKDDQLLQIHKV